MIYFDYSANYPVKEEVIKYLYEVETNYYGNANSIHELGKKSLSKYNSMDSHIKNMLGLLDSSEIVYTSSATESNNLAIKGVARAYEGFGKHILVSPYEHSSVNGALGQLKDEGYTIDFIKLDKNGKIDLASLDSQIKSDTILVITMLVESETGLINDVSAIADIVKRHPNCHHLVDATQGITKIDVDLNKLELVSFTPHKFGGLIGTGCLIKKKSTILYPLINGGKSSSIYRSGSIPLGLIASIEKSIELSLKNKEIDYNYVKGLQEYLLLNIKKEPNILVNSFDYPYIVNLSIKDKKASVVCDYLNQNGVCVSAKSACSISSTPSKTIMALYNNKARAFQSFRISLSSLTTKEEIDTLLNLLRSVKNV
jgi:cysteine desulfurase